MIGKYDNIKIQGISSVVPKYIEDNRNFENVIGKRRVKKQILLTGVEQRHISGKYQRASDLVYVASERIIEHLNWDKKEIKILIYITQSPNYMHPSTAFFLQKRLGLEKECLVYDMNLGCSSFNVGVQTVSALLQACSLHDKALLLLGDIAGTVRKPDGDLKPDDIAHDMLFGSAGAAIALEKVEESPLYYMNMSNGEGYDAIIGHHGRPSQMDGAAVFSFAINDVADSLIDFRNKFELSEDNIDYYIFHQAQQLILDNIIETCEISEDKELRSLRLYGNTSGVSVPVTACANWEQLQKEASAKILFCGFGVGLSWGCIYTEVDTNNILPIYETNEHYDEDKKPAEGLQDKNILVLSADTTLGEWISRYDDDKSAQIILAGTDKTKLCNLADELFMNTQVIISDCMDEDGLNKIVSYCEENEIVLDGVVIPEEMSKELLSYFINRIAENCAAKETSVVVIESVEDKSQFDEKKHQMQNRLVGISYRDDSVRIRVNGVLYAENEVNIVQITKDGQEWIEEFFERNCPEEMKKPIYVSKLQGYLMLDDSKYVTETVLVLNA